MSDKNNKDKSDSALGIRDDKATCRTCPKGEPHEEPSGKVLCMAGPQQVIKGSWEHCSLHPQKLYDEARWMEEQRVNSQIDTNEHQHNMGNIACEECRLVHPDTKRMQSDRDALRTERDELQHQNELLRLRNDGLVAFEQQCQADKAECDDIRTELAAQKEQYETERKSHFFTREKLAFARGANRPLAEERDELNYHLKRLRTKLAAHPTGLPVPFDAQLHRDGECRLCWFPTMPLPRVASWYNGRWRLAGNAFIDYCDPTHVAKLRAVEDSAT